MAWLVNSMEPKIGKTYLFYKTTQKIWQAMQGFYSDMENSAQTFQIRSTIQTTRQGNSLVIKYYSALIEFWQEMDLFHEIKWECAEDGKKYDKMIEKECSIFCMLLILILMK